jgi:hypothetical protein
VERNKSSIFFKQLITNPDLVDNNVITELITQYPYLSAFWYIRAKNSLAKKDQNSNAYVQQAALLSPQPELLYRFINKETLSTDELIKKDVSTTTHIKEEISSNPSLYHDDTMPYSFIWWLNKTRIEHAETCQPYAQKESIRKNTKNVDEKDLLDQQLREHIFHIQAPELKLSDGNANKTIPFKVPKKENPIIEKFIIEEPQIKPPSPEKVSLENKARKSAVDESGFVSETLAKIYTEQGLYHKAMDTYKKLSLKFPEKSLYFADLIKQLEKQN